MSCYKFSQVLSTSLKVSYTVRKVHTSRKPQKSYIGPFICFLHAWPLCRFWVDRSSTNFFLSIIVAGTLLRTGDIAVSETDKNKPKQNSALMKVILEGNTPKVKKLNAVWGESAVLPTRMVKKASLQKLHWAKPSGT